MGGGAFGQNAAVGGQGAPQSSLFGGQGNATAGFGGATSGFGGMGGQNQAAGFGNTGGQATFGFGGQQNATTGGFGGTGAGGGGLFGNQNKSGSLFGQNTGTMGAAGVPFGGGMASQGFGGAGTGAAGGTSAGFGQNPSGGLFGAAGNQNQFGGNDANQNQSTTKFFQAASEQQLCSLNTPFELRRIPLDDGKGQQQTLRYRNIRAEEKYSTCSTHMLRLGDLARARGAPQDLPEWKAQQEWPQRCQQYPLLNLLQKNPMNNQNSSNQIRGLGGQ